MPHLSYPGEMGVPSGAMVGQSWALAFGGWGGLKRYIWVDVREGLE